MCQCVCKLNSTKDFVFTFLFFKFVSTITQRKYKKMIPPSLVLDGAWVWQEAIMFWCESKWWIQFFFPGIMHIWQKSDMFSELISCLQFGCWVIIFCYWVITALSVFLFVLDGGNSSSLYVVVVCNCHYKPKSNTWTDVVCIFAVLT